MALVNTNIAPILKEGTNITLAQDGSVITITSSAGSAAGGSNTQIQFNDGGALNGDAGLTYDKTNNIISLESIDWAQVPTAADAERRLKWDNDEGSLDLTLKGGNVTVTIGTEVATLVYNAEGTTLVKGEVVYVFGAQGQRISVKLAVNTADVTSAQTLGVVSESIASGAEGWVIVSGMIRGINTSAYTQGDTIYLGSTAGTFTKTKPVAPNHLVYVGFVVKVNASSGEIFVKCQNGYEMDEIHDYLEGSVQDKDVISYESSTSLYKPKSITTLLGYTPLNPTRTLTINGTAYDLSADRTWSVGTVTSVAALTVGTSGTDLSSTVANGTTTPVITLNVPTASATNRGALSSADWTTFNNKFTLPALTSGSVLFSNGTTIAQDNANFFWDDTNNRLGIGTASPNNSLEVNGIIRSTGYVAGYGNAGEYALELGVGRTGNGYAYVDLTGDVTYTDYGLRIIRYNTGANAGSEIIHRGTGSLVFTTIETAPITFATSNSERLRITSGGNVGIGTTSPAVKLNTFNTNDLDTIQVRAETDVSSVVSYVGIAPSLIEYYRNIATGVDLRIQTKIVASGGGGNIVFSPNSPSSDLTPVERMRITKAGNVGIGLTSPQAILDVSHTAGTTNIIRVSNGSGNYRWRVDQNFSMFMTNASAVDTFSVTTDGAGYFAGRVSSTSTAPLSFQSNSNTGTYNQTVIYANQNNTSGDTANGIFIERGRLTDSAAAEVRSFVIGARGGQIQMILNKDGNLGLGVTPSAWGTRYKALQGGLNGGGSLVFDTEDYNTYVVSNAYHNGTNWVYTSNNISSLFITNRVGFSWNLASAGTGNISFTQAMTLDASGRLGIGETSPETLLHITKSTSGGEGGYIYLDNPATSALNNKSGIKFGTSSGASFASVPTGEITNIVTNAGSGASDLIFGTFNGTSSGERMRISSGGQLKFNSYTSSSSFTGTAAGYLAFDSSGNIITTSASAGGIGGSTGSVDNAILRADGTGGLTLQNSSVVLSDTADLTLGFSTTSGSSRIITTDGSTTSVTLDFKSKGSGGDIRFFPNNITTAALTVYPTGGIYVNRDLQSSNQIAPVLYVASGDFTSYSVGLGSAIIFRSSTSASNIENGGRICSVSTDLTAVSEDFDMRFDIMSGGNSEIEAFRIKSDKYLEIKNTSAAPGSNPSAGGFLYVESGALKYRGSSGTVTTIANA